MKRLKCVVAYDGTDFSGFQVQPDQVTIQGEIEAALHRLTGRRSRFPVPAGQMLASMPAAKFFTLIQKAAFRWTNGGLF